MPAPDAPAGVGVVQEAAQHAVDDEVDPPRRARPRRRGVAAPNASGSRRVVDERDARRGHLLALAARRTSTGPSRIASPPSAAPRIAEQRAGHERIEHDRQPARPRLRRAEQPDRARPPASRAAACGVEVGERPAGREPVARLRSRRRRPRSRTTSTSTSSAALVAVDARASSRPRPRRGVAVRRRLDAAHTRVGGARRRFEVERERDLVARSARRASVVAPEVERRPARPRRRRPASAGRATRRASANAALSRASASVGVDDVGRRASRPTRSPAGRRRSTPHADARDARRPTSDSTVAVEDLHFGLARARRRTPRPARRSRPRRGDAARDVEQLGLERHAHRRCRRR